MSNKFKGIHKGIFFFTLIIIPWPSTFSAVVDEEIAVLLFNVTGAKLGESCWLQECQAYQFCDLNFICRCLPGYKVDNNDCVPLAGENEKCMRQEDCSENLICFKGICKKPGFNEDFATLAKICLGVTIITIIIAIFNTFLKCIFKCDGSQVFQRQNDACRGANFTPALSGNVYSSEPTLYETQEEKPPSYEECIRSTAPPPYVISTNSITPTVERPVIQPINLTNLNESSETPLSVQNLNHKANSI